MQRNSLLHEKIAHELLQLTKQSINPFLPPVRTLGRTMGVSPVTILKAVHLLCEQGILDVTQGSRIRIRNKAAQLQQPALSTKIASQIRTSIEETTFKAGEYLPKISYFTSLYHIARDTVCEAFKTLEAEGIVYKEGRFRKIGKQESISRIRPEASSRSRPIVVIIIPHYEYWRLYLGKFHSRFLFVNLLNELASFNVDYRVVCTREELYPGDTLANAEVIMQYLRTLSYRLHGVVLAGGLQHVPDWRQWLRRCESLKCPAVLYVDNSLDAQSIAHEPVPKKCFRIYYLEQDIVRCCVDTLRESGITHALFINPYLIKDSFWCRRRLELIQAVATGSPSPLSVDIYDEPQSLRGGEPLTAETMRRLPPGANATVGKRFIGKLRSIQAKSDGRPVVLIAPNDIVAVNYLFWLRSSGIDIPRKVSLISFDNSTDCAAFPLTTIDFGFHRLGYLAAHHLIGDIPIRADRYGNVVSRPFLVDRGSL